MLWLLLAEVVDPIFLLVVVTLTVEVTDWSGTVVTSFGYGLDTLSAWRLCLFGEAELRIKTGGFDFMLVIIKLFELMSSFDLVSSSGFLVVC